MPQARRVRFHLQQAPSGLPVEIADDGTGFEVDQSGSGYGLSNLHARASAMQAALHLISKPGAGTHITLSVPKAHRWQSR